MSRLELARRSGVGYAAIKEYEIKQRSDPQWSRMWRLVRVLGVGSLGLDGLLEPPMQCRLERRIANSIPGYRATLGVAVDVLLGAASQRPSLWFPSRSRHTLARNRWAVSRLPVTTSCSTLVGSSASMGSSGG
jgi:hypothetical protein